jgi:hypothetical protein
MSIAREDFLLAMSSLQVATAKISSPAIGTNASRSAEYLQLNGLHVVAFALLEDFLKRRTLEVLREAGKAKVRFDFFPESLKLHVLQESFKGINFYLSRKIAAGENRLENLIIEILSLHTTADNNSDFEPSDFCFGKSQSNISLAQITNFLDALGMSSSLVFSKIMERMQLEHLGSAELIYARLAENRNSAAHAFNVDFDLINFLNDIRIGYRLIAFIFDTALSQAIHTLKNAAVANIVYECPTAEEIPLRAIRFDSIKREWQVARQLGDNEYQLDSIKEKGLASKLEAMKRSKHDKDDSIFVINNEGALHTWLQPI